MRKPQRKDLLLGFFFNCCKLCLQLFFLRPISMLFFDIDRYLFFWGGDYKGPIFNLLAVIKIFFIW